MNLETEIAGTDESRMLAVRDLDCQDSFAALLGRWQKPICNLCFQMVGHSSDAEDLTQDVFSNLYRRRDQYRVESKFSTYLWQIAVNRCRDFLRQKKTRKRHQDHYKQIAKHEDSGFDQTIEDSDFVKTAIGSLPEIYREVLVLKHFQGLSFQQVAQVAEIPIGTAASRMSKAMELLKVSLKQRIER